MPGAIGGASGAQLIASEALHLLAAGAWLGGLLPLFLAVGRLPHADGRGRMPRLHADRACVGAAACRYRRHADGNASMGGLPGLFGTGYGHVALLKLGLFVVLLVARRG